MKTNQKINKKYHNIQRDRHAHNFHGHFLLKEISKRINESLSDIKITFNNCIEIGIHNNICLDYIISKNQNVNYFKSDLSLTVLNHNDLHKSNKICFDHDIWAFSKEAFDLIVSNYYLNLSNDLSTLFNRINFSLKPNGFFLCAMPGTESLKELKDCMMIADQELYNGVYQRFNNYLNIENISNLLKDNNFKLSVIDNDFIELRYKNFDELINDIKHLGQSYLYLDKKKNFENKIYFKKVEEIYWKKYSYKNQLFCKHQVIFLSGWKYDSNQQLPLMPGEAKSLMKDVL